MAPNSRDLDLPFAVSIITDGRPETPDGGASRYKELVAEAQAAESLGFRAFLTSEQHAVDDGYIGAQLPVLAGIASVTSTLKLMTSTVLLPLYRLRQLAESAIVVDLLSSGRLELGLAGGAYAREFVSNGVDYHERGAMMERALPGLRRALTEGVIADGAEGKDQPISPRPAQARIPLLVGGLAPKAVDRAVRLADGHIAYDYEEPERILPDHWANVVVPALQQHGRSPQGFRYVVILHVWASEDPDQSWRDFYRDAVSYQQNRYVAMADSHESLPVGLTAKSRPQNLLVGTADEIAHRLVTLWHRSPWTELAIWYRMRGISHKRAVEHLEYFAKHVRPAVKLALQAQIPKARP